MVDARAKKKGKKQADKMSGKPSCRRGHPQINGQDAGAV